MSGEGRGPVVLHAVGDIGSDMKLIPEFRTGVVGQFALGDRDVDAALPALDATGVLAGNDSHEVRAALGSGVTLQMGSGLSAYVDLGGELGYDTRNGTATGGVRFIF